ncbi:MAG: hypothetical protein U0230_25980 [Polyangiales bacterium]
MTRTRTNHLVRGAAFCLVLAAAVSCANEGPNTSSEDPDVAAAEAGVVVQTPQAPQAGWNILQPGYTTSSLADGLSLEWDYYMIHDRAGRFTGIIGYVLADPRRHLGSGTDANPRLDLIPSGGNAAVAGQWADGSFVSDYVNFGVDATHASATRREMDAVEPGGDRYASLVPLADGTMQLEGRLDHVAWSLNVRKDWTDRPDFPAQLGTDMGFDLGEFWTVNMYQPRTLVTGTITNLVTGEVLEVDGHGYRENSYGRWAFVADGWDFAILSDAASGVQWAWQTYHHSDDMDYLDVSFRDGGQLKSLHLQADRRELGWVHDHWKWHSQARQCVPTDTRVVAQNADYRIEATISIGDRQVPLLSDATIVTSAYVIMEHFPIVSGRIVRRRDGSVVTTFRGQAGGEWSYARSALPWSSDWACTVWGKPKFQRPLP